MIYNRGSRVRYEKGLDAPDSYPEFTIGNLSRKPDSDGMSILLTDDGEPNLIVHISEISPTCGCF